MRDGPITSSENENSAEPDLDARPPEARGEPFRPTPCGSRSSELVERGEPKGLQLSPRRAASGLGNAWNASPVTEPPDQKRQMTAEIPHPGSHALRAQPLLRSPRTLLKRIGCAPDPTAARRDRLVLERRSPVSRLTRTSLLAGSRSKYASQPIASSFRQIVAHRRPDEADRGGAPPSSSL